MTVVAASAHAAAGTPVAASALKSRAPSMWTGTGPAASTSAAQAGPGPGRARRGHVRVLDADERHRRLVVLRRLAGPPDVVGAQHAVVVVELDELDAGVHGRGAVLVGDHVLAATRHDGGARSGQHPHRDLVGHDARGHEQRRRLAHPRRERLLQSPDRRVLAVVVVTDLGVGHGATHRRRGLGDGVAAQVDHVGHGTQVNGEPLISGGDHAPFPA